MKKIILFKKSVTIFCICFFLVACSKKDNIVNSRSVPAAVKKDPDGNSGKIIPPGQGGTLAGYILPLDSRPVVMITNNVQVFGPLYPDRDGLLRTDNLPAGDYSMKIHPANSAYMDSVITNLTITAGGVTSFGVITLQ